MKIGCWPILMTEDKTSNKLGIVDNMCADIRFQKVKTTANCILLKKIIISKLKIIGGRQFNFLGYHSSLSRSSIKMIKPITNAKLSSTTTVYQVAYQSRQTRFFAFY